MTRLIFLCDSASLVSKANEREAGVTLVQLQMTGAVDVGQRLTEIPGAQEVFQFSGDCIYLVKLRVTSLQELGRCLREGISKFI